VFSYAAMRVGAPLADDTLRAWDAALGFDWLACVRFVDRSHTMATALSVGYSSFVFQLLLLPGLLCAVRLPERAYRLILGYLILCTLSAIVGSGFPAEAAYVAHGLEAEALRHVDGHFGRLFLDSFRAARAAGPFTLRFGDVAGIVTFPSVHAGVAALCAWAAWPSRPLRALFLPLNLLMAASAITNGAHYLVDVIAGGAVAFVTVAMVRRASTAVARPRRVVTATPPPRLTQIA
jgi:membrane-associated phospholipid phosphatase